MTKAGEFLARIARRMHETDNTYLTKAIGVALPLIDTDKELSSDDMERIAYLFRDTPTDSDDDLTELGVALAMAINDV